MNKCFPSSEHLVSVNRLYGDIQGNIHHNLKFLEEFSIDFMFFVNELILV